MCTCSVCVCVQAVKARGNVENWLGLVEESMMVSLRRLTKAAIGDFETKARHEWATQHPSQVSRNTHKYTRLYSMSHLSPPLLSDCHLSVSDLVVP